MSLSIGASHSTLRIGLWWRRTDHIMITSRTAMPKDSPTQKVALIMAGQLCGLLAERCGPRLVPAPGAIAAGIQVDAPAGVLAQAHIPGFAVAAPEVAQARLVDLAAAGSEVDGKGLRVGAVPCAAG